MFRTISCGCIIALLLANSIAQSHNRCESINGCCIEKLDNQKRFLAYPDGDAQDKLNHHSTPGSIGNPIKVIAGDKGSPYFEMSKDISSLMRCSGVSMDIDTSPGSITNLQKVISRNVDAKFVIVQSDVLHHYYEQDKTVKKYARVVADLHHEEVHLITRQSINTWDQLAGKKIYVGAEGSGTRFTAEKIIAMKPLKTAPIIVEQSSNPIRDFKQGHIDAMFYVIGAPAENLYTMLDNSDSELHLIDTVSDSDGKSPYAKKVIPAGTYPNLDRDIATYSIDAVLVTYRWESNKSSENFRDLCHITKKLYDSLNFSLPKLVELGTPAENPGNITWADRNWPKVDLHRNAGTDGIAQRSECIRSTL